MAWNDRSKSQKGRIRESLEKLYGSREAKEDAPVEGVVAKATKKRIGVTLTEDEEQIRLVNWMKKKNILFFAVPNGGHRAMSVAIRLKATGVVAGVPDIVIPVARKGYHSLYIELKRASGGVTSDYQKYWLCALNREGMKAVVCRGAQDAILVLMDYFDLKGEVNV